MRKKYITPNCNFRQLSLENFLMTSNTVTVDVDPTETYDGSFNAKKYTPENIWDEMPIMDDIE
jgi:hypothetical protein